MDMLATHDAPRETAPRYTARHDASPQEMSPRAVSRLIGVLYFVLIAAGLYAQAFVSDRLRVTGDATATAANIVAHQGLHRISFSVFLVEMAAQVAMTVLFYRLLKPVDRNVSLLAATFGLVGCTIKTLARLFYIAPLVLLGSAGWLASFDAKQLDALAYLLLRINDTGAGIALAFFGLETLLEGWLFLRATFMPRALGVLAMISGAGWLTFFWPPLGGRLFMFIAVFALLGVIATIGWLLVVGVDNARWKAQAMAAEGSVWR